MTKLLLSKYTKSATRGFTLIELLVAIGVFSVVFSVAVGGFVRALRIQRQLAALIAANSNTSLAIEQMAREIRTGTGFALGGFTQTLRPGFETGEELRFNSARGRSVAYCAGAAVPGGVAAVRRLEGGGGTCADDGQPLTPDSVNVIKLLFVLSGNSPGDNYPARTTILISISPREVGVDTTAINLQTTVSARNLQD